MGKQGRIINERVTNIWDLNFILMKGIVSILSKIVCELSYRLVGLEKLKTIDLIQLDWCHSI